MYVQRITDTFSISQAATCQLSAIKWSPIYSLKHTWKANIE